MLHINPGDGNSIIPAINLGCRYFSVACSSYENWVALREDYLRALTPVSTTPYMDFMLGMYY